MALSSAASRLTFRPELDGIRAIGVILVVAQHWVPLPLPLGEASLTTFFVLSGYLITGIIWHQRAVVEAGLMSRGRALLLFYCRRALRILPAYYFTLFISFLLSLESVQQHLLWYTLHVSNILFYQTQHWGEGAGHFWSLAVEEQFYCLWPLLLFFWPWRKLEGWLLAALILGAFVFRPVWVRSAPLPFAFTLMPANMDAFAGGGLLRLIENRLPKRWPGYGYIAAVGWSIWFGICLTRVVTQADWEYTFLVVGLGAAAIGAVGLIGWVLNTPYRLTQLILLHPLVQWIGTRSYGLYLYHLLLVVVYQRAVYRLFPAGSSTEAWRIYWMSPWRMALVLMPVLVLMAWASWRFLELPFNAMKRFFLYEKNPPAVKIDS
ncbi:acyltransferase family protein [Hymenobacter endophyticus]|uniref:Acyltransferase n=1 Tax=Hymenobacter endophyticus TaxID=3076335 RepID=A0ABU3TMD5_9BACT|nr:acyltransferase [Hymenobacter endophyticus]MDU0372547.1 acyltransferase [Hymenobacter endophyticus]